MSRTACAGALALLVSAAAWAQQPSPSPEAAPDEGRYLGRPVPDILVRDAAGRTLVLAQASRERPVLLALVFSRCAGICSPFLASLRSAEAAAGETRDYRTVVVSFDPRDTAEDMAAMSRGLDIAGRTGWVFGVVAPNDVEALARAVGFWFRWDAARRQFDHPAMLVAIQRGRIVRLLVGGAVRPARLEEVLRELRGGFVAAYPLPGRVLFRCFEYDLARGRWRLDWGFALLVAPAAVTFGATFALFALTRRTEPGH